MTRKRWGVFLTVVLVLLFAVVRAHAAQEGAGGTSERATELFKWINFVIVAGLVGWVFLKLTPPFFRKSAEAINSAITAAGAAKAEAERKFREAESKLAQWDKEVADLRVTVQRETAAEAERIRNVTRNDVEKVSVAAKAEIEAAERAAKIELRVVAADLAVKGAESLLAKRLTPETQESLVTSFVSSLDRRPN
jgi:F-type H+-transporting ATPase subunit b